jgi:hypothetical protein
MRRKTIVVTAAGAIVMVACCATGAAAQDSRDASIEAARLHTQMVRFEGILRQAVRTGADQMTAQVRRVLPDAELMLGGSTEVTGYRLEGYGAFFTVRVPMMTRTSTLWLRVMTSQQAQQRPGPPKPGAQGTVTATSTSAPARPADIPAPPLPQPFVDSGLVTDPDAVYTREVQNALIDAMLDNSAPLRIGPGERLTIAARDSAPADPLASQSEFHTLLFTIKGTDLIEYRDGKTSLEEARKKVSISEE